MVEIEFWNGIGPPEGVLMEDFMSRFQSARPDIKVNQWTTEWEAFYTKIRTTYAEGLGPDLAVTHPNYLAQYGNTVFKPIDDLLEADGEVVPELFAERAWHAGSYLGDQYALPLDIHCYALYCNVGMLEAAGLGLPQTEDDLVQVAKALTVAPDQWGLFTHYQSGDALWEWIGYMAHRGQEGILTEDSSMAAFNNQAGIEALQRMYDNVYLDKIGWGPDEGLNAGQAFMAQKCAMLIGGTWEKFGYDTVEGLRYTSLMFLPKQPGTWGSSHLFVFPQMGTEQETVAAWDAAKYIVDNFSVEWGVRAGHVPALITAANAPEYMGIEEMQGFRDSVPHIVYLPKVPQHEAISEALIGNLSAALRGQAGIEEALSAAETQVNEILAVA
jgi:multiple sugar transport system substrate-binding protein